MGVRLRLRGASIELLAISTAAACAFSSAGVKLVGGGCLAAWRRGCGVYCCPGAASMCTAALVLPACATPCYGVAGHCRLAAWCVLLHGDIPRTRVYPPGINTAGPA